MLVRTGAADSCPHGCSARPDEGAMEGICTRAVQVRMGSDHPGTTAVVATRQYRPPSWFTRAAYASIVLLFRFC